jgi:hypothetical protein
MSTMQILNQLYAGKKITLSFHSHAERETFRQKLYKLKKRQDDAISAVLDEEKLVLKSKQRTVFDLEIYEVTFWVEEKKAPSYTIVSVRDTATNDAGQSTDADPARSIDSSESTKKV